MGKRRDTIVIGASMGGVTALRRLLADLPPDLQASVLVTQHQARGEGRLAAVLGPVSRLPVIAGTAG
jgi:two-component system chemotaxis response regulator CheB